MTFLKYKIRQQFRNGIILFELTPWITLLAGFYCCLVNRYVMENVKRIWIPEKGTTDITLTKEKLMSEIRRIKRLKSPVTDKILEIRYLVEQYFKLDGNEEVLNANLPL